MGERCATLQAPTGEPLPLADLHGTIYNGCRQCVLRVWRASVHGIIGYAAVRRRPARCVLGYDVGGEYWTRGQGSWFLLRHDEDGDGRDEDGAVTADPVRERCRVAEQVAP